MGVSPESICVRLLHRAAALFAAFADAGGLIKPGGYGENLPGLAINLKVQGDRLHRLTIVRPQTQGGRIVLGILFEVHWRPGEALHVIAWERGDWERAFLTPRSKPPGKR